MRTCLFTILSVVAAGCGGIIDTPDSTAEGFVTFFPQYPGWNAAWSRAVLGAVYGTPAIVSLGAGQYELFYAATIPANASACHLQHRTGDGDHWSAPDDLGDGFRCESPAAVQSHGRVVLAAAKYADGSTWTRTRSGTYWYDWVNLGGVTYAPVAIASTDYKLHIFVIGTDGRLYQITGYGGAFWNVGQWQLLGGVAVVGTACASPRASTTSTCSSRRATGGCTRRPTRSAGPAGTGWWTAPGRRGSRRARARTHSAASIS